MGRSSRLNPVSYKSANCQGFKVITPVMPWGLKRMYDADYPTALSEIEASVEILRKKGAKRIIVAGHSFGANASIAYAASGREVDGVIAIAPGHCPDLDNFGASVAKARQMIAKGKAEETASFDDNPQGQHRTISTTAKIYLSFFDPDGLGPCQRVLRQYQSRCLSSGSSERMNGYTATGKTMFSIRFRSTRGTCTWL